MSLSQHDFFPITQPLDYALGLAGGMVKQRMSTADVAAEAACLRQRLLGMRVANIYDVTPKVGLCLLSNARVFVGRAFLLGLLVKATPVVRAV